MKPSPSLKITPQELAKLSSKVPDYLKVTDKLLQEIAEDQKKLREKLTNKITRPSSDELALHYANEYEKMARVFFAAVEAGASVTEEEKSFQRRRLAQALQTQGRYQEALEVLSQGSTTEELVLLTELAVEISAIETPDELRCACQTPGPFPTTHIVKHVRVNGNKVPLVQCVICGFRNATSQLPDDLVTIEKHRAGKRLSDDKLFS